MPHIISHSEKQLIELIQLLKSVNSKHSDVLLVPIRIKTTKKYKSRSGDAGKDKECILHRRIEPAFEE